MSINLDEYCDHGRLPKECDRCALVLLKDFWKSIAEKLLERMKLINGPEENCVIRDWKECQNHKLIREVEAALKDNGN